MSGKSVVCAWGRAITLIGSIVAGVIALAGASRGFSSIESLIPALLAVMSFVAFMFFMWHPSCTNASFARACQLGELLQMNNDGMRKIESIYGEAAARGFDVMPAIATDASTPSAAGISYSCRVCRQGFTFQDVYAEADDTVICKSCWEAGKSPIHQPA